MIWVELEDKETGAEGRAAPPNIDRASREVEDDKRATGGESGRGGAISIRA